MIRKARKSDLEAVYPILNQIFDEMDMDTINRLPESQFYDLIRLGFHLGKLPLFLQPDLGRD